MIAATPNSKVGGITVSLRLFILKLIRVFIQASDSDSGALTKTVIHDPLPSPVPISPSTIPTGTCPPRLSFATPPTTITTSAPRIREPTTPLAQSEHNETASERYMQHEGLRYFPQHAHEYNHEDTQGGFSFNATEPLAPLDTSVDDGQGQRLKLRRLVM